MESRSNLAFLHSKEILKIFLRIYLQFQGFCVWKLNETKRFTDLNEKWMILYMYKAECQSEFRNAFYGSLNIKVLYVLIFMVFIPTV